MQRDTLSTIDTTSTVKQFFRKINARDFSGAWEHLDEGAVYSTGGRQQGGSGRRGVLEWFEQVLAALPAGAVFVMDDLVSSGGGDDPASSAENTVVARWHLEVNGVALPWSTVSSSYSFGSQGKLALIKVLVV